MSDRIITSPSGKQRHVKRITYEAIQAVYYADRLIIKLTNKQQELLTQESQGLPARRLREAIKRLEALIIKTETKIK